jgi:hypothetical protein
MRPAAPTVKARLAFGLGRPRETTRATIPSGKSENRLGCPMDNPALPLSLDRVLPFRRLEPHGKSAEKNFCSLCPRNPLISLDSDERIQGNPRKSNPHYRGFCSETAGAQDNPNRVVWTT